MSERLFPAEFVLPGHPDKLCDAIADALVVEAVRREAKALVGVEVAVHRDRVFVTGRIGCEGAQDIDVAGIVREVYRSAGYGDAWSPTPAALRIDTDLCLGPLLEGEAEFRVVSDDQVICVGYAVDRPETNWLPVEQWLVARLARRLYALRDEQPELGLGPDGKVLVMVAEDAQGWALERCSCSLQQHAGADGVALHRAVRLLVENELARMTGELRGLSAAMPGELLVNGAGDFEFGGPEGDNGLSGKKLVMDAYGPRVPIGGGAWSGKDFYKADRSGAIHARRLAKLMVVTGLAPEAVVTLALAPGDREPRVLRVDGSPGGMAATRRCQSLLRGGLAHGGERWSGDPALVEIARWGHFGNSRAKWEDLGRL